MSTTRRAPEGAPISYEKYMSSQEYAELRGIPGTAVAAKAQLQLSARKRSLLFFLQSLSLKDGGLRQVARAILCEFPERLGTSRMHEAKSHSFDYQTARKIASELRMDHEAIWGCDDEEHTEDWSDLVFVDGPITDRDEPRPWSSAYKKARRCRVDAEVFLKNCRERDEELSKFLVEVCINPRLPLRFSSDEQWLGQFETELAIEKWPDFEALEPCTPSVPYFRGIMDALVEFQDRYTERVKSEFVMTSIAQVAFDTLDHALLNHRKLTVVEGLSGSGKTTAVEAWCAAHQGQVRYDAQRPDSQDGILSETRNRDRPRRV